MLLPSSSTTSKLPDMADDELMQSLVGMPTARLPPGHVEHHEVTLPETARSARIRRPSGFHECRSARFRVQKPWVSDARQFPGANSERLCSDLVPVGILSRSLGRVAHDDGVGGNRTGHHGPSRLPCALLPIRMPGRIDGPCADGRPLLHYVSSRYFSVAACCVGSGHW